MWKVSTGSCPLEWKRADEIKVGWALSKVSEVWDTVENYETGWMGGFLDGEGYLSNNSQIGVGQNEDGDNALCFDEAVRLFRKYMPQTELVFNRSKKCVKVRPNGLRTGWQAVGIFQPKRLKAKLVRHYHEGAVRGKRNRKGRVISVRSLGIQTVVAIQTSTKTFLAEGFLSHNCSMEIGVSAYLTQSERLMEDLRNGVDFHLKRASYVAEISYDEAVANYARDPEVWKEKRREAKAISFAKAYGAHPEKISEDTGLPLAVVEKVFKAEDAEYPEIAEFNNQVEGQAKLNRIPSQKLLQIRDKQTRAYSTVPGEQEGIGYYRSATGKKYHFIERGSDSEKLRASGKGIFRYFKSTEIANYPVQGTAADIMAFTVSKVFRYLLTLDSPDIKMINEVHDSLVLDVKDQATADLHGPKIKEILEGVKDATKSIVGLDFNVFIPVDFKYGQVWGGGE
jgi:hypothetical protein